MIVKSNFFFTLIGLSFLLLQSCKCDDPSDPNCPNYDPCRGQVSNFANFYMEEGLFYNGEGEFFRTDTTLENNNVRFTIFDQNVDSVKWFIGADPNIRKGKSINITFDEPYGEIKITAIVYKEKAASCISGEDGIDTLTKSVFVLDWWRAPYFGTFTGKSSENPEIEFASTIDTISSYRGLTKRIKVALLTNFPNGYNMPVPTDGVNNLYRPFAMLGYKGFIQVVGDDLDNIRAKYNNNSKILKAEYFFNPQDGSDWIYKKTYEGKKE